MTARLPAPCKAAIGDQLRHDSPPAETGRGTGAGRRGPVSLTSPSTHCSLRASSAAAQSLPPEDKCFPSEFPHSNESHGVGSVFSLAYDGRETPACACLWSPGLPPAGPSDAVRRPPVAASPGPCWDCGLPGRRRPAELEPARGGGLTCLQPGTEPQERATVGCTSGQASRKREGRCQRDVGTRVHTTARGQPQAPGPPSPALHPRWPSVWGAREPGGGRTAPTGPPCTRRTVQPGSPLPGSPRPGSRLISGPQTGAAAAGSVGTRAVLPGPARTAGPHAPPARGCRLELSPCSRPVLRGNATTCSGSGRAETGVRRRS